MRIDFRNLEGEAVKPCEIFVNGRPLEDRCFLADEEAGEAHCYVSTTVAILDDDGNLKTEVLRGKVEIRPARTSAPNASLLWRLRQFLGDLHRSGGDDAMTAGQAATAEELKARLDDVLVDERPGGWIPVSERLPEPGEHVLVRLARAALTPSGWNPAVSVGHLARGGCWYTQAHDLAAYSLPTMGKHPISGDPVELPQDERYPADVVAWMEIPPLPASAPLPETEP